MRVISDRTMNDYGDHNSESEIHPMLFFGDGGGVKDICD